MTRSLWTTAWLKTVTSSHDIVLKRIICMKMVWVEFRSWFCCRHCPYLLYSDCGRSTSSSLHWLIVRVTEWVGCVQVTEIRRRIYRRHECWSRALLAAGEKWRFPVARSTSTAVSERRQGKYSRAPCSARGNAVYRVASKSKPIPNYQSSYWIVLKPYQWDEIFYCQITVSKELSVTCIKL